MSNLYSQAAERSEYIRDACVHCACEKYMCVH